VNQHVDTTIGALRAQLVQARRQRSLALLHQVEDGLLYLGQQGYRCCLVDYASRRPRYYVRLLGYANARVKARIEFPIAADLKPVQWLPLSHLADYDEVDAPYKIERIYGQVADFIHRRDAPLVSLRRVRALPAKCVRRERVSAKAPASRSRWWYAGSLVLLSLVIGGLIALRMGDGYY
jgi:hypothetical protein